jgi:membrane protease YdiL (CAAX protease family)
MTSLDLGAVRSATHPSARIAPAAVSLLNDEQHSLPRSVALHLLPGFAGMVALLIAAPLLASAGWPPLFAFYGPMSVTIVAVEAGYLWREHRRRVTVGDPRPILGYRRRLRAPLLVGLAVGLFLVGSVATGLLGAIDGLLAGTVFAGLPTWWLIRDPAAIAAAPGALVAAMFAVGILVNGFVGPIVEEAYFRGHLLPRLSRLGWRAPILNAVLFSLYHLWQPWAFASRLGYVLPYALAVHRTRSIYLGMAVHCAANLLGILLLIALVAR